MMKTIRNRGNTIQNKFYDVLNLYDNSEQRSHEQTCKKIML